MTADRWSDLLAFLAGVVGLVVVLRSWPRLPRRSQVARLRHPSTPPPVGVSLDTSAGLAHWRVTNQSGALSTMVDIVTWQPVSSSDDWRSEPIIEPVVLAPGASAVLPLVVDDPTTAHLVVVAWTVKHPGGDVQGSRTLTVGTATPDPPAFPVPGRGTGWTLLIVSALMAGLLTVLALVAGWRLLDGDDGTAGDVAASPAAETLPPPDTIGLTRDTTEPSTTLPSSTSPNPTSPSTTSPSSTSPNPTSPSTTSPSTTSPSSTSPNTTSPSTEALSGTTTTTSTTTTPATTTTAGAPATDPDGRSIDIRGRVEDCRFGADCVIASFSAIGFPNEGDYVCEFDDGSRFTFRYAGGGALDACATSGATPSITIEIDGVRSATITRATVTDA